jgi:hypothetical protein
MFKELLVVGEGIRLELCPGHVRFPRAKVSSIPQLIRPPSAFGWERDTKEQPNKTHKGPRHD